MSSLFFLLLATAVFTSAAETPSSSFILTRTSVETSIRCRTHSTSATAAPTPLPTNNFTKTFTRKETTTITTPSTVLVTGTATTYTPTSISYIYSTVSSSLDTQTSVTFIYDTITVGTLTTRETVCTIGASASITSTVYTGTYVPPGGPTRTPKRFPDYVNCTTDRTTHLMAFPTVTSGVVTFTYNPGTPVPAVIITSTRSVLAFNTPSTVTVTSVGTSYVADRTTIVVSTSCPAAVTTTYAAKCSGPNLINQVNGYGIAVITYAPGSAAAYGGNGRDASACCQLCQENVGCAAFDDFPAAANCALHFTNSTSNGEGQCGLAFSYGDAIGQSSNAPIEIGQGSIVGTGCGSIEPVADGGD
ncbi:hypothetical protein EPUS_00088 [Endocarpon pusillum Z07020]|uniref:Apple domain-containing protein n=1 Tax=Endocarpon pusillum (strain Z07020 / HMAS-L-300199) TaxID=1263415 RepID=U1GTF1_ENDPU|nr:uncharacterized protein EPUS_00088 [Endocarpon pusillum Z07020]ERF75296.1 hypothetical protein EPUS_00088 [Endocarpon pusillum Z07020]